MDGPIPLSKIRVPQRAHPLARTLYGRMLELGITYDRLEHESGVKKSTFKAFRTSNVPGVDSIQVTLRVVGLNALPVPAPETLPPELLTDLQSIGRRFGIDAPIAQFIAVAAADGGLPA